MKTPTLTSPYNLLQEQLRHDPWKLLVACIMLNQTSNVQVKDVIWSFFDKWPDSASLAAADTSQVVEHIRPLGLYNRRAKSLQSMSRMFCGLDLESVSNLPGVGKYALDSYKMFILGELDENVQDKELKRYLSWARNLCDEEDLDQGRDR